MPEKIRFHLDENISHAVANGLLQRGIDVTTTSEVGLRGASDLEQIQFARSVQRVILTQDKDFLRLHLESSFAKGMGERKINWGVSNQLFVQEKCVLVHKMGLLPFPR